MSDFQVNEEPWLAVNQWGTPGPIWSSTWDPPKKQIPFSPSKNGLSTKVKKASFSDRDFRSKVRSRSFSYNYSHNDHLLQLTQDIAKFALEDDETKWLPAHPDSGFNPWNADASKVKSNNNSAKLCHSGKTSSSSSISSGSESDDSSPNIEEELSKQSLYKTELCRSFTENGSCRYGSKCQFAHGEAELRHVLRHPKYKTELCKTFSATGSCPYGTRCRFIHPTGSSSLNIVRNRPRAHSLQSYSAPRPSLELSKEWSTDWKSSTPSSPLAIQKSKLSSSSPATPVTPSSPSPKTPKTKKVLVKSHSEIGVETATSKRLAIFEEIATRPNGKYH